MISLSSHSLTAGARRLLAAAALVPALMFADRAEAGILVDTTDACAEQTLERPFLPWADPAAYTLVPQGSFGQGTGDWQLSKARVIAEDKPFRVNGDRQPAALRVEAGGSVTSPPMCVGLEHPTLRLFARNDGSWLGTLNVEALVEAESGHALALPIGGALGHARWAPTLPLPVVANLLPVLPGEHTLVAFRFTATGSAWVIDDVYVDPYRKG